MNEHQRVVVAFQVLANEILAARSSQLVAVDGRAGSGKTTFATRLRRFLPGAVVTAPFLDWSDLDDWWPRLEKEALAPLLGSLWL